MKEVIAEFERVRRAFDEPALTLLYRQSPRFTVTVFRICFSRDEPSVPVARLHLQVDNLLAELRAAGTVGVPEKTGRQLCLGWVKGQWLNRTTSEVYTLTSQAQKALDLVDGLTKDRSTLSEHRIATILDTVRRFNAEANPSVAERVLLYDEQIDKLVTERDRLLAGGEIAPPRPDFMLNGYIEVLDLISALPADFKRVQEAFEDIRKQILEEFRSDARPAGALIAIYLQRAEELVSATAEGRAFDGALALLRDPVLLDQLRNDLQALLDHPQARDILDDDDRRGLRNTVLFISRGLSSVLAQRSQTTRAIRTYIQTHDVDQDRELDSTLRALDHQLEAWLGRTGPRTTVDLELLPAQLDLKHLPRQFHDPAAVAPPPPLQAREPAGALDETELAQMLLWGGPNLAALRQILEDATRNAAGPETLAELFNSLAPDMRRPVEILGLHYLADRDNLIATDPDVDDAHAATSDVEEYHAVRPDGTTRTFRTTRTRLARTPSSQEGTP